MATIKNSGIYIYGQLISLIISTFVFANIMIVADNPTVWPYALFLLVYLLIYINAQCYIYFKNIKVIETIPWYRYLLSGVCNFLGDYFLFLAYSKTTSYIIVLFSQLLYPKLVLIETFIFKSPSISIKKLISFLSLIIFCFLANYINSNEKMYMSVAGILLVNLSNLSYAINLFGQVSILEAVGIHHFLKRFSIFSIISGYIISIFHPNTLLNPMTLIRVYKTKLPYIILFMITKSIFLQSISMYINSYGVVAFNASIISYSVYFGTMMMIINGNINWYAFLLFGLCIIADLVLVSTSKIKT
ncbi:hypothetical protein TCON_0700 [Astathelohania contejeani]|uniref:Uncharacterized protein n=1 Tax=Astathelohania contejeani TaxID=164912 RepID=A0ABQ7I0Y7_9MICR|nr:hypothetical protein TCON_0700 [Thelohania contejeani]